MGACFSWHPSVIKIFADKNNFGSLRSDKADSFYNCVTTLLSNQVNNGDIRKKNTATFTGHNKIQ